MKTPIEIAPDDFTLFRDEMMLISVEETANGKMVTFQIPPEVEICPFSLVMDRKKGPGTRFYASFIELDDDDEPINQRKRRIVEADKPASPIKSVVTDAGIRCRSPQFQRWVHKQLAAMSPALKREFVAQTHMPYDIVSRGLAGMESEKIAAEWAKFYIYWICKIRSRRDLGTKRGAANRYNQGIVIPFDRWANSQ